MQTLFTRSLRHFVPPCLLLLAGLAFSAGATTPPVAPPVSAKAPATKEYRWEGYNDKPVEARLGPHRYMIPANYFADQMGPDFQENFGLMVQWPDLQPLPPGERSQQDMETFQKTVTISPDYIDRVPIESLLEKSIRPFVSEDSPAYQHPSERLDLRDKQPQRFGLTPYYVNREKLLAYAKLQERMDGHPYSVQLANQDDWYLLRDVHGRLMTVIKCDSHLQPDGFILEKDRLVKDGSRRSTGCTHRIVIREDDIDVVIEYRRAFLKDWKRIEDRARELLTQYRTR